MALQVDAKRVKGSGLRNDAIIVKSSSGSKSSSSSESFRIYESIENKVKSVRWRQAFMNKLIEIHHQTVPEPAQVKVWTQAYRHSNANVFERIRSEYLEKDGSTGSGISRPEMEALVRWYVASEKLKVPENSITEGLDLALAGQKLHRNKRRQGPDQAPGWKGWKKKEDAERPTRDMIANHWIE